MDTALPLIDPNLEDTDPVLAHVTRFANDVAWRHRHDVADPGRFLRALTGYYRAWSIGSDAALPELDERTRRLALRAYRRAHRAVFHGKREHRAA